MSQLREAINKYREFNQEDRECARSRLAKRARLLGSFKYWVRQFPVTSVVVGTVTGIGIESVMIADGPESMTADGAGLSGKRARSTDESIGLSSVVKESLIRTGAIGAKIFEEFIVHEFRELLRQSDSENSKL